MPGLRGLSRPSRWLILLSTLLIAGGSFYAHADTERQYQATVRQIDRENLSLARSLHEHISRTVDSADDILLLLKSTYEREHRITQSMRSLVEQTRSRIDIQQISVADAAGNLVLSALPLLEPITVGHREHFKVHAGVDTGKLFVGRPVMSHAGNDWAFFITRRLNGPSGEFAGIVSAGLDVPYLLSVYGGLPSDQDRWVILLGKDGFVRAMQGNAGRELGLRFHGEAFIEALQTANQGTFHWPDRHGSGPRIGAFSTADHSHLIVAVTVDKNAALASYLEHTRGKLFSMFLFAMFVAFGCFRLVREIENNNRLRKQTEILLRELIDNAPFAAFLCEARMDGHLVIIQDNRKACESFGPKSTNLCLCQLFPGLVTPEARQALQSAFTGQTVEMEVEGDFNDARSVFEMVATPVGEGKMAVFLRDVSERKRAEAEQAELARRTVILEKMASLGTMVASVTHEINQPLQAMKMATDGILYWHDKGKPSSPEGMICQIRRISDQITRLSNIVRRMRDFVRREPSSARENIDVDASIAAALELVAPQVAVHGIRLDVEKDRQLPTAQGHRACFEEALANILVNAIQALDGAQRTDKRILIHRFAAAAGHVTVEICNNGPKIPPEIHDKIFEPFFTTKTQTEGLGLGLHIVRTSLQAFGGDVMLRNHEENVCFSITLPTAPSHERDQ